MIFKLLVLLLVCWALPCMSSLHCEIKKAQSRSNYNIGDNAANGIVMTNGANAYNLQVFECSCTTNDEIFDDKVQTTFEREFYKANAYDWSQSQVLRINNCSVLELNLKNGRNTLSATMAGRMLIVEDIAQLILSDFTVGLPSSSSTDDTFSSIYFRNVTFYQVPAFIEFSDRAEVLFSNVKTNEGSSKVEPFELKVKNTNHSVNSHLKIEYSRFGGINILVDGFPHNVFILNVQNLQPFNNTKCYKDYKGSVQLLSNYFGYLRDKNINIVNGHEFIMEDNFVDILYGNPIALVNLKQTRVRSNMFGMQVLEPMIMMSFFKGGAVSSCSTPDLQENMITQIDFSGNQVKKLTTSSYIKLDIDPGYSINFVDRIMVGDIRVALPCNCTEKNSSKNPSDTERLGQRAIKESQCIPWRQGQHLIPPQMARRTDSCSGGGGFVMSQQYASAGQAGTQASWLSNNPFYQQSKNNQERTRVGHNYLIFLTCIFSIFVMMRM